MAATINGTGVIEGAPPIAVEETEVSGAMQTARYCSLEESLGLIFGALTVGYIVMSFAGLAG
jgi:hypothetical protein